MDGVVGKESLLEFVPDDVYDLIKVGDGSIASWDDNAVTVGDSVIDSIKSVVMDNASGEELIPDNNLIEDVILGVDSIVEAVLGDRRFKVLKSISDDSPNVLIEEVILDDVVMNSDMSIVPAGDGLTTLVVMVTIDDSLKALVGKESPNVLFSCVAELIAVVISV